MQQLDERLKREGIKTHKERVEDLNRYLSNLSEHHDMYVPPLCCRSRVLGERVVAVAVAWRVAWDCEFGALNNADGDSYL